jgi:hypothetical protein
MGAGGALPSRFLSGHPSLLRVGLSAERQVFPELPGQTG